MIDRAGRPAGNIYDLGYRGYEGVRLGRRYAIVSLFTYTLRGIFGVGRSWMNKFFPIGLAIVALVPSLIQVAIAALIPAEFEFIRPEEYFEYVSIVLALFCAATAPEIVGRDQRTRTISLYFSRALSRLDYATAKLLALILALFVILITPQLLLIIGKAVAAQDLLESLGNDVDLLPPILASSFVVAVVMSGASLAIASQTSRRAFSTGGVLAYFIVSSAVSLVLLETLSGDSRGYAMLLSPLGVLEGAVVWIFNATPGIGSDVAIADIPGPIYFLGACFYAVVSIGIYVRRLQRIAV